MFAGKSKRASGSSKKQDEVAAGHEHELTSKEQSKLFTQRSADKQQQFSEGAGYDERQTFLIKSQKAKLAKQETLEELAAADAAASEQASAGYCWCCCSMMLKCRWLLIPLLIIICCMAAIYCIPFVDIEARVPKSLPHIPFNYRDGPLRASTASQFKIEHLFDEQIRAAESVALDSQANMYLAIEGGFILYAHLNKSSLPKRTYYLNEPPNSLRSQQSFDIMSADYQQLVKIAELNGLKQQQVVSSESSTQKRRSLVGGERVETRGSWRRDCQLDEQIYGQQLYSEDSDTSGADSPKKGKRFVSNVVLSRCSKPLGVRLSPDESYLYVVDTLTGLYRVDLKNPERPFSTQRSVNKLIDFKRRHHLLPVIALDETNNHQQHLQMAAEVSPLAKRSREHLNISLMAVDDLVIDYGAGSKGGDMIYLTDASQNWHAISFVFDMLEGRPSGAILRYDTAINQLSVLSPSRVAHVRTSVLEFDQDNQLAVRSRAANLSWAPEPNLDDVYLGLGAPKLDENDIFDDRPLSFPNGLELTDDKEAILIADTTNKRIIKHFIKGSRRGTSDLWAWTPNYPDNIRRGYDRGEETYWVVGCGEDTTNKVDLLAWLHSWPKFRKYMLKNLYLMGWFLEAVGGQIFGSSSMRDLGYSLKMGNSLCQSFCPGMMILQYNKYGDIIRSIYSREFPNDVSLYSQVNEVIDAKNQEHLLYLSSPTYKYVTKLVLPSDSFDVPPTT